MVRTDRALDTEQVHALTTTQISSLSTDDFNPSRATSSRRCRARSLGHHVDASRRDDHRHLLALGAHTIGSLARRRSRLRHGADPGAGLGAVAALTTLQFTSLTTTEFRPSRRSAAAMTSVQAHALTTDQIVAFTTQMPASPPTTSRRSRRAGAAFESVDIQGHEQRPGERADEPDADHARPDGNASRRSRPNGVNFDVAGTATPATRQAGRGGDAFLVRTSTRRLIKQRLRDVRWHAHGRRPPRRQRLRGAGAGRQQPRRKITRPTPTSATSSCGSTPTTTARPMPRTEGLMDFGSSAGPHFTKSDSNSNGNLVA